MKRTRHNDRTYRLLESWGWVNWWPVERHNAFSGRKTDLFHIIDILALTKDGIVGVQSCGQDFSGHRIKMMIDEEINTRKWLRTPGTRLVLIGWRKVKKKRGGKAMVYKPRIAWITLSKKGKLKFKELPREN